MSSPEPDLLVLAVPRDRAGRVSPVVVVTSADTLRHPDLPQPDGLAVHECLNALGRLPGAVHPLAMLRRECAVPALWSRVADWDALEEAVVGLARAGGCEAVTLAVPPYCAEELAGAREARPDPLVLARVPRPSRQSMLESVARQVRAESSGRTRDHLALRTRVAQLVSRGR